EKKKSSISGEENNAIGDLLIDKHAAEGFTLLFLGAGGHVNISGILNLLAFGVQQPLDDGDDDDDEVILLGSVSVFSTEEEVIAVVVAHLKVLVFVAFFCFLSSISTFCNFILLLVQTGAI
ncbi:hypothetical protein L195_g044521, partial [Trifolium pratense]